MRPLGEVCDVIAGQSPPGSTLNTEKDGLPFYQGKKDFSERYVGPPAVWTTEVTKEAAAGDILMSVRAPVGPINYATQRICIGRGLAAIRPKRIDPAYLFYLLLAKQPEISGREGAVFASINKEEIRAIQLPVPPLAEQQRIVAILDEAFEAIAAATANAEKNLGNLGDLQERLISCHVFGNEQDKWNRATVSELVQPNTGSIRTGPFGSQLLHSEFVGEGIAVLGIDNVVSNEFTWAKRRYITTDKFRELSRYRVWPGDVLISIMGTCGRCAIVPVDIPVCINTKHICCITLDKNLCIPEFLKIYFLHYPEAREFLTARAKGSIMAGLNMGIIKELPVRLPPLEEQKAVIERFEQFADRMRMLSIVCNSKISALAELKQSLLARAFSGALTAGHGDDAPHTSSLRAEGEATQGGRTGSGSLRRSAPRDDGGKGAPRDGGGRTAPRDGGGKAASLEEHPPILAFPDKREARRSGIQGTRTDG